MATENSQQMELVNGDGDFNDSGFEDFIRGIADSIPVIAIVGPQSSGKSTLMNHLFYTDFKVMNAQTRRGKTTNGIWIAKAPDIEPLTVVLDLEGTDGKEKGADDTAFEKQSALFAIKVAHTVIINMWCHDVGREYAGNRPLLKTVFEAMLSLSLFSPQKTTLHFVVRDGNNKTGTPSEILERNLKEDIEEIWEAVPKILLIDIFNVEVTVLSHYEYMRDEFDKEMDQLQMKLISNSTSKFSMSSAKNTWEMIKEIKTLDPPSLRHMYAKMQCGEIVKDKLRLFQSNQAWLEIQQKANTQIVKDFGAQIKSIFTTIHSEYDKETVNFENRIKGRYDQQVLEVRSSKRQYLTAELLKVVSPAYKKTLGHIRSEALQSFTTQLQAYRQNFFLSAFESFQTCYVFCVQQFDLQCSDYATIEQANWEDDASTEREELHPEIKEHALNQLRVELSINLSAQVSNVVRDGNVADLWANIRSFIETETEKAKLAAYGIFGTKDDRIGGIVSDLEQQARETVRTSFTGASLIVHELMRSRFRHAVAPMDDGTMLTREEAYGQCLDVLSTMAVIRLDDTYDVVERVLRSELLMNANNGDGISLSSDTTWENVPGDFTLIPPLRCKQIWTQFTKDMEDHLAIVESHQQEIEGYLANFENHLRAMQNHLANVENHQKQQEPRGPWSFTDWASLGLRVLEPSLCIAFLDGNQTYTTRLAISLGIARGLIEMHRNGIFSDAATHEEIHMNDVQPRHPELMAHVHESLNAAQEILSLRQRIRNIGAPVVA